MVLLGLLLPLVLNSYSRCVNSRAAGKRLPRRLLIERVRGYRQRARLVGDGVSRKPRLQAYTGLSTAEATCISRRQVSTCTVVHVSRKPRLQAYTCLSMAEATCISRRQVSTCTVVHVSRKPRLQAYTGLSTAKTTCNGRRQVSTMHCSACE